MARPLEIPRLVVAGVASHVGKTTVTVALTDALRARGLRVATFKCGPDYIDPGFHALASGRPSPNLDGWMMGRSAVRATFARAAAGSDIALIEGVMGLFDGAEPQCDVGSTAEIARWLEAPVLLVADASGLSRSLAALAAGFADFDPMLEVLGVLANRLGSRGHLELLHRVGVRPGLLGGLPREPQGAIAERHLGLTRADAHSLPAERLRRWGELAAEWIDLDALLGLARGARPLELEQTPGDPPEGGERVRVGVARDDAFHFYYDENLALLHAAGADLVEFSPLRDELPPALDGVILGGGYPELFAEELASRQSLLDDLRAHAQRGAPLYAECGGLMYASRAIVTLDGRRHAMLGLVPAVARVHGSRRALGYVEAETLQAGPLGPAGTRFRGHQFRYSELEEFEPGTNSAYSIRPRRGAQARLEGWSLGGMVGSWVHAHWASNPTLAAAFVRSCRRAREVARA
jgi:cobyrinic acid a,c-diamide synthase